MFNMTALAIRSTSATNAVSQVHGRVTLDMWAQLWPSTPERESLLKTVTNGVHVPTWIAPDMVGLLERYLGVKWKDEHDVVDFWDEISNIPDEELWAVRETLRSYLVTFIRERARQLWTQKQVTAARVVAAGTVLGPTAINIGL